MERRGHGQVGVGVIAVPIFSEAFFVFDVYFILFCFFHRVAWCVCCADRERLLREEKQRKEAEENLQRLRKRHEADKESARRTYMESKR